MYFIQVFSIDFFIFFYIYFGGFLAFIDRAVNSRQYMIGGE